MKHIKYILIMGLFSILFDCRQSGSVKKENDSSTGMPVSVSVEHITPTREQQERRNQSEAYCKSHNVPVYTNPDALFTNSDDDVTVRTKDEVVDRALALCFIGLKSEGLELQYLDKMAKDYKIYSKLSPKEKDYVKSEHPVEQQTVNANWRYESLHVMLWALNFIDTLDYPGEICNVARDVQIIYPLSEAEFRQKAKLRSKKEILDQADLILRLHWACVSARLKNEKTPGNLESGVVYERHYSLNWLINDLGQDWDDLQTNT